MRAKERHNLDLSSRRLVPAEALAGLMAHGTVVLGVRTILTPLAQDRLRELGAHVVRGGPSMVEPAVAAEPGARIAIGSDHGGFAMKKSVIAQVAKLGFIPQDVGCFNTQAVDYPDIAERVAVLVAAGEAARGIVLDGAGIGSCMVANKVPGVRAALAYDLSSAGNAREHNDANVLTLGARLIGEGLCEQIVCCFLNTAFGGGRHQQRVNKIHVVERRMGGQE